MRVYYAHPLSLYDTPQETRDIATLEALGRLWIAGVSPDWSRRLDKLLLRFSWLC